MFVGTGIHFFCFLLQSIAFHEMITEIHAHEAQTEKQILPKFLQPQLEINGKA